MGEARKVSVRARPLLLGALAVGLGGCGFGGGESDSSIIPWPDKASTGAEHGDRAPNFALKTSAGEPIEMASLTGVRPLVINFLATWCANCMEEMDVLVKLHRDGVQILGVNLREKPATVQSLIKRTGAEFPILLDETGTVTRAYKVVNLPATVVLTAAGEIASVTRGPVTDPGLRDAVATAEGI